MTGPHKKLVVILTLVIAAGVSLFFALNDPGGVTPGPIGLAGGSGDNVAEPAASSGEDAEPPHPARIERAEVTTSSDDPELDPLIRAALCGFRGRVVDHKGTPMPELVVELLRFGIDTIVGERPGDSLAAVLGPKTDSDRAVTGSDGTFQITGQWPEAIYVMFAGVGADNPRMVVIDHTPGPGEMVDLGDIALDLTATVVGRVVGDDDEPLPGALVRAADIPGAFTAMVPLERFDPEGALIIFEGSTKRVIEFPSWAVSAYERLPIPRTTSGADGTFRLTGVAPGNNLLAVTSPDRLSHVDPRLPLEAGEEKDVGDIQLREGDEVWGRVVDTKGAPVAGAQVLVGQASTIGPIAFASWAKPTNQKGEFSLTGFRGGKVVGAARRRQGDPWVISEEQPVVRDLILQLPGAHELTVRVMAGGGAPIEGAELKLTPDTLDEGMGPLTRMGFFPPADLEERVRALGEGRYVIADLAAGRYRLEVTAAGYDVATADFELAANLVRTVQLDPVSSAAVVVVDEQDSPIRNAAVHASPGGEADGLPTFCGRTDSKGHFSMRQMAAGPVKVFAHHPAFGWVSGKAELPAEEVRLVMKAPGVLRGVLTEDGEIPELGKYMVLVMRPGGGDDDGSIPRLAAPDPRGMFEVVGLQPGSYRLMGIQSIRAIRSLGSVFAMAQQSMFFGGGGRGGSTDRVEVRSHVVTETQVDVRTGHEPIDGPSAQVRGTVLINGRPGTDMMVMTWSSGRRSAEVDAAGRFDLGDVAAGSMTLSLYDTRETSMGFTNAMWQKAFQLEADRDLDVVIDLTMGMLSGRVVAPDGTPAGRSQVELDGAPSSTGEQTARVQLGTGSDDAGVFRFEQVPAGVYQITARSQLGRGARQGVQVHAGAPTGQVEVVLQRTVTVSGRINPAGFGSTPPTWVWVGLEPLDPQPPRRQRSSSGEKDNTFEVDGVAPGRYRVEISAMFPNPESTNKWSGAHRQYVHNAVIEVTDRDLQGVVLVPVLKEPEVKTERK